MAGELLQVDVGDLSFDVRVDGPDDGRPVLLLHGFPETSLSWAAVVARLTARGLRTYAPDQLGYSPGARPAEVEAYSMPNPSAYTAAWRDDAEQQERSAYIRLFWQAGKAEEVLKADDWRRLRRML